MSAISPTSRKGQQQLTVLFGRPLDIGPVRPLAALSNWQTRRDGPVCARTDKGQLTSSLQGQTPAHMSDNTGFRRGTYLVVGCHVGYELQVEVRLDSYQGSDERVYPNEDHHR